MSEPEYFLHIADVHLMESGTSTGTMDVKSAPVLMEENSREELFHHTLRSLSKELRGQNIKLSGVFITGDTSLRGDTTGMRVVRDSILENLSELGVEHSNLIVVPGNHDVLRTSRPSSMERYESFVSVWGDCVIPNLDGLELSSPTWLKSESKNIIIPVNSCNWSQSEVDGISPEFLDRLKSVCTTHEETQLLERLTTYDAAYISDRQLDAIGNSIEGAGEGTKIALLHHHLLPVNTLVEAKPFSDLVNLGQFRQFLLDHNIKLVVHGHKHSELVYSDLIKSHDKDGEDHEVVIVSGGALTPKHNESGMQLIGLSGSTCNRKVKLIPIPISFTHTRKSYKIDVDQEQHFIGSFKEAGVGPRSISSDCINELYERAKDYAALSVDDGRGLICTLDLSPHGIVSYDHLSDDLPFPTVYPYSPPDQDIQNWLKNVINWWQLENSLIQHRIPFIHGGRLKRFAGKVDQISRIASLLKQGRQTTKALATLIDPVRDFKDNTDSSQESEFASFCLVQFSQRKVKGTTYIDVIAYYRAQEIKFWWPINIAELFKLISDVKQKLTGTICFGKITTIAADVRFSTNASRPPKVAVPMLEQWYDIDKAKLSLIASTLVDLAIDNKSLNVSSVEAWKMALEEMELSAKELNTEGTPVAIDSLKFIADYLRKISDERPNVHDAIGSLLQCFRRLIECNEVFFKKDDTPENFNNWSKETLLILKDIKTQTSFDNGQSDALS